MDKAAESGLEVEPSTSLEVAPQPDGNKYYVGGGGSDFSVFTRPDQSLQFQAKNTGRSRAIWVLATITIVCLAVALGAGLGAGLAVQRKSSSSKATAVTVTKASDAPITIIRASNAPFTITQASGSSPIASSASQQSSPPSSTPSSTPPAISSVPTSPPSANISTSQVLLSTPSHPPPPAPPVQSSSSDKGPSICSSIDGTTCQAAYSQYNDTYLYTAYTSYILASVANSSVNDPFSSFDGDGCAAMFTCNDAAEFAVGMTGAQIKAAFDWMYQNDEVQVCGTSFLSNGCKVTTAGCSNCKSSVPCGSSNAENDPNESACYS